MSINCTHVRCHNAYECRLLPAFYTDPHNPNRVVEVTAVHRDIGDRSAIAPIHVMTLLEQNKIALEDTTDQFCAAIQAFLRDVPHFTWKMMSDIMGSKHIIERGCCASHVGLVNDLTYYNIW